MPFTPSHVAAVLPLTGRRGRRLLPPAALVIGSMVPDLPYFAPTPWSAASSHAWYGPPTVDLAAGMIIVAAWWLLLRAPCSDLAPRSLRLDRNAALPGAAGWLTAVPAVIIGAVTHVVWDTFSHPRRWGTDHLGWLVERHGLLLGYKWVQYGSGLLGGSAVLIVLLLRWRRASEPLPDGQDRGRRVVLAGVISAVFLVGGATWAAGVISTGDLLDERVAVTVAIRSISTLGVAVLVVSAVWWGRRLIVARRAS